MECVARSVEEKGLLVNEYETRESCTSSLFGDWGEYILAGGLITRLRSYLVWSIKHHDFLSYRSAFWFGSDWMSVVGWRIHESFWYLCHR